MPLPESHEARREYGETLRSDPSFESITRLIDALLGEGGCPWDRARKLADCPRYLEGELQEVVEAIEFSDDSNLEEELGDLLFMVAFTAKLAEKEGRFNLDGLFQRILDKMVFRHPHVFGGELEARNAEEVLDNWQKLKSEEKSKFGSPGDHGNPVSG
jgi:tetrapyrrole methylase family protein/MazG family protein